MRIPLNRLSQSASLALLFALFLAPGAAPAGGFTPCDSPFIFEGAAANIVPIEYLATSADKEQDERLSALQETAQRLSWLIKLDSWHQPTYGSLGVVAHMFLGQKCEPDEVLQRLLLQRGAGPPVRPGQILVMAQGKIFIEGEQIFLQTRLRGFRRAPLEAEPDVALARLFTREGIGAAPRGEKYRMGAGLPDLDVTFAPRAMTKAEFDEIEQVFRQASRLYSEPSETSGSQDLSFVPETRAFQVEIIDGGEWLKLDDFFSGLSGYIHSDPEASRFLHRMMPELDFLNGMLGYLRVRQGTAGIGDYPPPPDGSAEHAMGSFARFLENDRTADEKETRALASAMVAALDAWPKGDWVSAGRLLRQAVELAPYTSEYRNMQGVVDAYLCCADSPMGEYGDPARDFSDALSLAPDNTEALKNLRAFLNLIAEFSAPAGIDASRLEERLEVVQRVVTSMEERAQ